MRLNALASPVLLALVPAALAGCALTPESQPDPTLVSFPPVAPPTIDVVTTGTVRVPARVDATGGTDVAADIQAIIDEAADGSRIVFPADGEFRLDSGLVVDDRSDLVFEGNGSRLLATGCGIESAAIIIGRGGPSSGIAIRGFSIEGANANAGTDAAYDADCQHTHGVSIYQSSGIEIGDVDISSVYGDCIYVGGGGFDRSEDVYYHDSSCRLTGRQGIAITAGDRVHVEDVAFDEIGIMAFDIEPNLASDGVRGATFTNNTIGTTGVSGDFSEMFFGANGNLDAEVRDVVVSNNVVTGSPIVALVGDEDKGWSGGRNHHDITFVGNQSPVEVEGPVVTFKHVDGLTVYGNEQPLERGELVRLVDTVNADVR